MGVAIMLEMRQFNGDALGGSDRSNLQLIAENIWFIWCFVFRSCRQGSRDCCWFSTPSTQSFN